MCNARPYLFFNLVLKVSMLSSAAVALDGKQQGSLSGGFRGALRSLCLECARGGHGVSFA